MILTFCKIDCLFFLKNIFAISIFFLFTAVIPLILVLVWLLSTNEPVELNVLAIRIEKDPLVLSVLYRHPVVTFRIRSHLPHLLLYKCFGAQTRSWLKENTFHPSIGSYHTGDLSFMHARCITLKVLPVIIFG